MRAVLGLLQADEDAFGVETLAGHHLPLAEGPRAHRMFDDRADGCLKVVLQP